jgi:pyridoxine kinase
VQSHVTYGHVGNAAAVFPLQWMGFDVWPLHTCLLSNHTGYEPINGAAMRGEIFAPEVVASVVQALEERHLLAHLSGVLSGWLGKASLGEAVARAVTGARQAAGDARRLVYLCDPVLGDDGSDGVGRLYTAPDIPQFITQVLLPLADVITPNRFELSVLSGLSVSDQASALVAARSLLGTAERPGPRLVVVTSLPHQGQHDLISCLAVTDQEAWQVVTPRLTFSVPLSGTGDCLAALMMGALLKGEVPAQALSHAVSALYAILQITQSQDPGPSGRPELALVAAQRQIENPQKIFDAMRVS